MPENEVPSGTLKSLGLNLNDFLRIIQGAPTTNPPLALNPPPQAPAANPPVAIGPSELLKGPGPSIEDFVKIIEQATAPNPPVATELSGENPLKPIGENIDPTTGQTWGTLKSLGLNLNNFLAPTPVAGGVNPVKPTGALPSANPFPPPGPAGAPNPFAPPGTPVPPIGGVRPPISSIDDVLRGSQMPINLRPPVVNPPPPAGLPGPYRALWPDYAQFVAPPPPSVSVLSGAPAGNVPAGTPGVPGSVPGPTEGGPSGGPRAATPSGPTTTTTTTGTGSNGTVGGLMLTGTLVAGKQLLDSKSLTRETIIPWIQEQFADPTRGTIGLDVPTAEILRDAMFPVDGGPPTAEGYTIALNTMLGSEIAPGEPLLESIQALGPEEIDQFIQLTADSAGVPVETVSSVFGALGLVAGGVSVGTGIVSLTQGDMTAVPQVIGGIGSVLSGLANLGAFGALPAGSVGLAGGLGILAGSATAAGAFAGGTAVGIAGLGTGLSIMGGWMSLGMIPQLLEGLFPGLLTNRTPPTPSTRSFWAGNAGINQLKQQIQTAGSLDNLATVLGTTFAPNGEVQIGSDMSMGRIWAGDQDDPASLEWAQAVSLLRNPEFIASGDPRVSEFIRGLWIQGPGQTGDVPANPELTYMLQSQIARALPDIPAYKEIKGAVAPGGDLYQREMTRLQAEAARLRAERQAAERERAAIAASYTPAGAP